MWRCHGRKSVGLHFVRMRENPVDGIREDPGHLGTFLEHIFFGMMILEKIGENPRYIQPIIDFVLKCRTKSGGFARSKVLGIPTLESTYHAISILSSVRKNAPEVEVVL